MLKKKKWRNSISCRVTRGRVNVQLLDSLQAVICFRQSYLGGKLYRTVNVTLSIIIVHIDYCSVLLSHLNIVNLTQSCQTHISLKHGDIPECVFSKNSRNFRYVQPGYNVIPVPTVYRGTRE